MITHKSKTKRNYQMMLKETVEMTAMMQIQVVPQVLPSNFKKRFKYSSRVGGGSEYDDIEMKSPLSNDNQIIVQKSTVQASQAERIKSEIEKYRSEISKMSNPTKYCPCENGNKC